MACRCYEVRCTTGAVLGNSSGIPYPLKDLGGGESVYGWARNSSAPLTDDYGRPFPGNPLNGSNALFTRCWNATDQPAKQVTVQYGDCSPGYISAVVTELARHLAQTRL